jgi:hypothetical protein
MASVSGGRGRVEAERRQLSPHSGNVLATVSSLESLSARNLDIFINFVVFDCWDLVEVVIRKVFVSFSDPTIEINVVNPDPGGQK